MNRPNVLMVVSDQHMAACMGHEGHKQAITPHLDRLAREGVRMTAAYAANAICTPARVSMLSGQYPHNHGYYGLSGPEPGAHGTSGLPSLFGHFRAAGYRTAGIGKLHLPDDPENWVADALDHYADCYWGADGRWDTRYLDHLRRHGLRDKEDSVRLPELPGKQQHEGRPSELPYEHSVEGWCAREAIEYIDGVGDDPFFMQVSLPRPHQCYTPDRGFWDMYPADLDLPETYGDDPGHRPPHFRAMVEAYRAEAESKGLLEPKGLDNLSRRVWRGYLAAITQCDHALGEILDHLETRGIADDTVVVYVSDHGAYSTSFGVPEKAPGICSEHVCRVPMLWRVPGLTPAGARCDRLVEQVDLAPTFCSLAGLDPMETVDGHDITPLLRGEDAPVREAAVTENAWSKALRWRNWRFVHYPRAFFGSDEGELYDIEADPNERRNLYHDPDHAEIVHECRRRLLDWLVETSRAVTFQPPAGQGPYGPSHPLGGDGNTKNGHGPRTKLGLNHGANYL